MITLPTWHNSCMCLAHDTQWTGMFWSLPDRSLGIADLVLCRWCRSRCSVNKSTRAGARTHIYQDKYLITYLNLLKKANWKKQINKFSCADIVVVDDCKQLTQQSLCFDEESCMLTSTKLQPIHTPLHPCGQSGITIVWLCTAMIWKTMSSWKLPCVSCSFSSKTSLQTTEWTQKAMNVFTILTYSLSHRSRLLSTVRLLILKWFHIALLLQVIIAQMHISQQQNQ